MIGKRMLRLLIPVMLLAAVLTASAQGQPVVYAVLFFSPTCGHCHYVITETLPPLQAEFGERFQVVFVDVSVPDGGEMLYAACTAFNVPEGRCGYVPTLVIGSTVLIGSGDIPTQLPTLVREGLAAGGIDLPAIPGLQEAYEAAQVAQMATENTAVTETAPATPMIEVPAVEAPVESRVEGTSWQQRFQTDPLGNGTAVMVLGILTASTVMQLANGARQLTRKPWRDRRVGHTSWIVTLGIALVSAGIAGTLILEQEGLSLPTMLAGGVTLMLVIVAGGIGFAGWKSGESGVTYPAWLLPLVAVSGLLVAGYLAFVEVGQTDAVCGAVGDCNTVQQSAYARLFGVLPIGVVGVAGYLAILGAWLLSLHPNPPAARLGQAGLLGLALFGVVFSNYLTFLEPFVIGATCAWCLTSAMLMLQILWLQAPTGWAAVSCLVEKPARWQYQPNQPDW